MISEKTTATSIHLEVIAVVIYFLELFALSFVFTTPRRTNKRHEDVFYPCEVIPRNESRIGLTKSYRQTFLLLVF
jgi:NADH:ubiquinone oxidoreductase subunit 3 (subunit A)